MTPAQAKHRLLNWSSPASPEEEEESATESVPEDRGRRVRSRLVASLRLIGTALAVVDACRDAFSRDEQNGSIHPDNEGDETMRQSMNSKRGHATADPMTTLRSDVASVVKDVSELVGSRFGAASNRTRDIIDGTRERAVAAHERIAELAGQRPLTTIAVSAVAGVVALKLLSLMRSKN